MYLVIAGRAKNLFVAYLWSSQHNFLLLRSRHHPLLRVMNILLLEPMVAEYILKDKCGTNYPWFKLDLNGALRAHEKCSEN